MGSWNTPQAKSETAFLRWLQFEGKEDFDGVQIITRFSNQEITFPNIRIVGTAAPIGSPGSQSVVSGNWLVSLIFRVTTHYKAADQSDDECLPSDKDAIGHDEIVGLLADYLMRDDLITSLNTIMQDEDFTAQYYTPGSMEPMEPVNHRMMTEIRGELMMSPSKL